eukprot:TRINITY_DN2888_c2_g3_i1.p1 TRINITY_DN2888_c2_g3~~TRINITY_DN2888_c2_g3_i1.p1  ORF type:complete len:754 (+),score=214.72 TRINITY_DN2888_c2_g3_i1:82-2262(+)
MPPPPSQGAGTLTARSDGVSCCADEGDMLVYGGQVAAKVWALSLDSLAWRELVCEGDLPPPRLHHSAVCYGGHMLVFGGELLGAPQAAAGARELDSSGAPPYYELDLETQRWRAVMTTGEAPAPRSHHTAVARQGAMVVFGGRRTDCGRPLRQTRQSLDDDRRRGFFEVYVLDIAARRWSRVSPPAASSVARPMLWGHSAVLFRHFMLCFGGFELAPHAEDDGGGGGAPQAELSDTVYIWNMQTAEWSRCGPRGRCAPQPRALHCAAVWEAEMLVFGGMSLDPATGHPALLNDAWWWDVAQGTWAPCEWCLRSWPSKRLLFAVHASRLVVCPGVAQCFALELRRRGSGWRRLQCDASALCRPASPARPRPPPPRPEPAAAPAPPPPPPTAVECPGVSPQRRPAAPPPAPAPPADATAEDPAELHRQLFALQEQVEQLTGVQRGLLQGAAAGADSGGGGEGAGEAERQIAALSKQLAALEQQQRDLQSAQLRRQQELMAEITHRHEAQLAALQLQRELAQASGSPAAPLPQPAPPPQQPGPAPAAAGGSPLAALAGDVGRLADAVTQLGGGALARAAPPSPQEPDASGDGPATSRLAKFQRERERKRAHEVRRMQHLHSLQQRLLQIESDAEAQAAASDSAAAPLSPPLPAPAAAAPASRAPPPAPPEAGDWDQLRALVGDDFATYDPAALPIGRLLSPPGSCRGSPSRLRLSPPRPAHAHAGLRLT